MLEAPAMGVPPWVRVLAVAVGLLGSLALCAILGFCRMFSRFSGHDEGYMLITIKSFNDGQALYDEVFSLYGPLPSLLKWGLFSLLRQPVGHDVGRLIGLGYWLATAIFCGAVAWRLTCSVLAGWAAFLLVFLNLGSIVDEPGHPQELCALLLAIAAFLATFAIPGRRLGLIAAGLGVVAACLALTKMNIFLFLAMALGAAMLAHSSKAAPALLLRVVFVPCVLVAPALLMSKRLEDPSVQAYAGHVALALIPALILGFGGRRLAFLGAREYACAAGGFAVAAALIFGALLLRGTSPYGLLEGIFLIPLRVIDAFGWMYPWFRGGWPYPVGFSLGALAWVALDRAGHAAHFAAIGLVGAIRLYYGVSLLVPIWHESLLIVGLPAASLILIPRTGEGRPPGDSFGRVFLAFLAVTESLWAFPIPGTQVAFAIFLAILVMVILVADGCHELAVGLDRAASIGLAPARDIWARSQEKVVRRLERSKVGLDLLQAAHLAIRHAREFSRRHLPSWLTREVHVTPRLGSDLGVMALRDLWPRFGRRVLVPVVQVGIVAILLGKVYHETRSAWTSYRQYVPLGLPGSSLIRLDARTVDHYRRLTHVLRARPGPFITMPGMNSLYFWAEREPPTSHNTTHWMRLLDDRRQAQVVEQLEAHPDLCLVVSPAHVRFWMGEQPLPKGPLVRYVEENFTPWMCIDDIIIKVRKPSTRPKAADMRRGLPARGSREDVRSESRAGAESQTRAMRIFRDDEPPATSSAAILHAPRGTVSVQDYR